MGQEQFARKMQAVPDGSTGWGRSREQAKIEAWLDAERERQQQTWSQLAERFTRARAIADGQAERFFSHSTAPSDTHAALTRLAREVDSLVRRGQLRATLAGERDSWHDADDPLLQAEHEDLAQKQNVGGNEGDVVRERPDNRPPTWKEVLRRFRESTSGAERDEKRNTPHSATDSRHAESGTERQRREALAVPTSGAVNRSIGQGMASSRTQAKRIPAMPSGKRFANRPGSERKRLEQVARGRARERADFVGGFARRRASWTDANFPRQLGNDSSAADETQALLRRLVEGQSELRELVSRGQPANAVALVAEG